MGIVYKARHLALDRIVALKMILHGDHAGAVERQRFRAEALAVGRLQHPNIVQVFEVGEVAGRPFFSLEYLDGGSLTMRCGVPTPPRDASALVARLARAVHYAHERGIVHRDLKPANVLLRADGTPKIADFGLAKHLDDHSGPTLSGAVLGTPSYMAPEQAAGRRGGIGPPCDVYALGAILYELLTGRPPFRGEDHLEILCRVFSEEPLPPSRSQPGVPRDLETICLKCLEKTPPRRYPSAAELALDLERYLAGEPIRARPVGRGERLLKWVRRRPAVAALWGLALAAVLLSAGLWGWQARARASRRLQTARAVEQTLDRAASLRGRDWGAALAEVRRAEVLLEQGEGSEELRQRVAGLLAELEGEQRDRRMVEQLEERRLPLEILEGELDFARANDNLRAAFVEYGIDVLRLPPDQAADRVRARPISDQLTAALDYWARLRARARPDEAAGWQRLSEVARRADADPLRNGLRDALARKDVPALRALAADPRLARRPPSTLLLLSGGLAFLGDIPSAVKVLRRAHEEHPGDFWINHNLAYYLYRSGPPHLAESVRFYTAAVALRSRSAGVRNNLGKALHQLGRVDDAITAYRRAIRLNPRFAEPHAHLGNAWRDRGKLDEAIGEYRRALALQQDCIPALLGLARVLQQQGKPEKALALCRRAVALRKDSFSADLTLADALRKLGQLDEAVSEYHRAIALRPDHAPAYKNLGIALWKQGRLDEAIAEHEKALRLRPGYPEACNNLANVLVDTGQLDRAIALYRQAVGRKKGYAEAHCNLGKALQRKGQLAEALIELKRGHDLGSKRPDWSYPSGRWARACERLLALEPRLPEFLGGTAQPASPAERLELATLCRLKGRHGDAVRFYQEAFAAQPELADPLGGGHRYEAARGAGRRPAAGGPGLAPRRPGLLEQVPGRERACPGLGRAAGPGPLASERRAEGRA
jgi:serine/threonine-protein kinase